LYFRRLLLRHFVGEPMDSLSRKKMRFTPCIANRFFRR
jgi:hypothetical protein